MSKYEEQKEFPKDDSPPLTPEHEKHKYSSESPPEEIKPQDIIQPIKTRRFQELGVDPEEQQAILDYYESKKEEKKDKIIAKRK